MLVRVDCKVPYAFLMLPGHERVCLLLGRWQIEPQHCRSGGVLHIERMLPVPNAYKDKEHRFGVSRHWLEVGQRIAAAQNKQVVGVLHTHIDGCGPEPSEEDIAGIPDGYVGMVFHVPTRKFTFY